MFANICPDNPPPRLALSHNFLQSFPVRFAECTSLRYLNVRQNEISEFPLPVSTCFFPNLAN